MMCVMCMLLNHICVIIKVKENDIRQRECVNIIHTYMHIFLVMCSVQ